MNKIIRGGIKIMCILLFTCIMLAVSLYLYVYTHRALLLQKVEKQFNGLFDGKLQVGKIEAEFFKQFPNISIVMKDVHVQDNDWPYHHQELLQAQRVYLQIRLAPLINGKFQIRKFIFTNGKLNIVEDSCGWSNHHILKKRKKKDDDPLKTRKIQFEQFIVHYKNPTKHKDISFKLEDVLFRINHKKNEKYIIANGQIYVHQLGFNTTKGVFLKNKKSEVQLIATYNFNKQTLVLRHQKLRIGLQELFFDALFQFTSSQHRFQLNIQVPKLIYNEALSCLSERIQKPLHSINIQKPFQVTVSLEGKLSGQPNPHIVLVSNLKNNVIQTKFGLFDQASMNIAYDNGGKKDSVFSDRSSTIQINKLQARHQQIRFSADSSYVSNLTIPVISTHLKATFEVDKLNNIFGKKSFLFQEGKASIDLYFKGCIARNNDSISDIDGTININKAKITYLPRKLQLNNCSLLVQFNNQDIAIKHGIINTQKSTLIIRAEAKNFLTLYIQNPEKIRFTAEVNSNKIDLNEFESFVTKRQKETKDLSQQKSDLPDKIDQALDLSRTDISLNIGTLFYKKFKALNIQSKLSLLPDGIQISEADFEQSGGKVQLDGRLIEQSNKKSHFTIQSRIQDVALDQLLYSFGSFGQLTLLPNNIRGRISLNTALNGQLDDTGRLVNGSIYGYTKFTLTNGALINFKPLMRMGKMIFKKERLEHVKLGVISNTLTIKGNAVQIPDMLIRSNLLNMQLSGVYNLDKGTELDIRIPLFENNVTELYNFETAQHKGYWMYIKAKEDALGVIKYSWRVQNKEIAQARSERKKFKKIKSL